ncbi:unnamed protein product [Sympodiomycopsis kandeliae]
MCNPRPKHIKLILFDIGGVVVGSPIAGVHIYEKEHNLPYNYLNVSITARGREGAFQRLERSEIDLWTFYEQFGNELSDVQNGNKWYKRFCESRGIPIDEDKLPTQGSGFKVNGRELFGVMMRQSTKPNQLVVTALQRLKESKKFKLAALTNNFSPPTTLPSSSSSSSSARPPSLEEELSHLGLSKDVNYIKSLFDTDGYYESSIVGSRKPEEKFYLHALKAQGVLPEETLFLDDIGPNLKAAQKLGIRTIKVGLDSPVSALEELQRWTGVNVLDESVRIKERERIQKAKI